MMQVEIIAVIVNRPTLPLLFIFVVPREKVEAHDLLNFVNTKFNESPRRISLLR